MTRRASSPHMTPAEAAEHERASIEFAERAGIRDRERGRPLQRDRFNAELLQRAYARGHALEVP